MCDLYSITTNQAAILALFRVVNHYVGNLQLMPSVVPAYPAPVIRNTEAGTEMTLMRWACRRRPARSYPADVLDRCPIGERAWRGFRASRLTIESILGPASIIGLSIS